MSGPAAAELQVRQTGRQGALAYLRLDPGRPADRHHLLDTVLTDGALEQMLLGLVDIADDVALTHWSEPEWTAWLDEHLAASPADEVAPIDFAGHKRALALLRLHDSPRPARARLAAAAAAKPAVAAVAVHRLADFIDRFHAEDRPAWEARLDTRIAALAAAPNATKEL